MSIFHELFVLVVIILIVAVLLALLFVVMFAYKMIQKNWTLDEALAALKKSYAEGMAELQQRKKGIVKEVPGRKYKKRGSVMTNAEQHFFASLKAAIPEAQIFPKMRVADVIEANERWSGDFLKISQKHFDWVLCHPSSYEPLLAIELDDSSHRSRKSASNDATKDSAAHDAGLPLMRFQWSQNYDTAVIRERISGVLNTL